MKPLSTLRNRIFLATTLLAVLPIGATLHFVTARLAREAEEQLRRRLHEAATLVDQHHRERLDTLKEMARLIADLPRLKAAVADFDPPTLAPVAHDYHVRVGSDLFVVTDGAGRELVRLGAAGVELPAAAVARALRGEESTHFVAGPQAGLLELVTVPLAMSTPPEVLGTLSLGFALDHALAGRIQSLTGGEVAFALDGRIRAASFPAPERASLAGVLERTGVIDVVLDGDEHVALVRPLEPSGTAAALVLRSRAEGMRFLRTLRTALALASAAAVAVAVLLSYAVARSVTRPLAALTGIMREMAATGDLTRRLGPAGSWDDEDARLLAATFNTLTESIARFQREAALRERLSALGRLSTVIAHEVRNPLMIIKASLRTLRRDGSTPQECHEAAADIDHEVARLDRIVSDVLDFARPLRLDCAPTDLNALAREAAQATLGSDFAPVLAVDLDPGLGPVVTDAERLRTVLVNVLTNARESVLARRSRDGASAAEGVAPGIELRTAALEHGRVGIVVRDRGLGIAPEDLPHVFEPYFTTKRTGSGLGLAIAKNIVEALGGTVTARSAAGQGSEIRVELVCAGPAAGGTAAARGRSHERPVG